MKNKRINTGALLLAIFSILSVFLLGFKINENRNPNEMYGIYLDGKKIGTVQSADNFNKYINEQEETIRQKYNVDEIYTPKGVEIKKIITYSDKTNSNDEIYKMLVDTENFTVKGYVISIKSEEEEKEPKTINVLDKKIFDNAIVNIIKAFVNEDEYTKFMSSTQEPILTTGELIEDIYIQEDVTYKEAYIPTSEKIFTDESELTKFLLYGTTEEQTKYIVKEGDTIETIAEKNKLNVQEFLIANTDFTSVNNLLYETQEVYVGLINPLVSIVVEKHSVQEEVKNYTTDIKYDSELVIGYSYVEREGENGLDKVTRKYQYINGQMGDVAFIASEEIKPSVSKILVKGDKYVPNVADLSYWSWPTATPYTITTYYGYRWGQFHGAIDIALSYGSPIYAANNGTVVKVGSGCVRGNTGCNGGRGNYIIINHNIGSYYTQYMHLSSVLVKEGQTVGRGQKIATMGNSGYVVPTPPYGSNSLAGTHLDFGLWKGMPYNGGYHINPYTVY